MSNERHKRRMSASVCVVGAVALALGLCACGKPAARSESRTEHPVLVVTVHFAPAVAPRNLVGTIKARVESNLGFRVTGKIAQRLVDRGAVVKAGQPLAILDRTDWELQLQQAQAALSAARASRDQAVAERDRVAQLRTRGWSTASDLDKASATADQAVGTFVQAERAVALQQNALSYATLVADADGVVTATLGEPGQVVASGQAVVTLAHAGEPEADVSIPEALLERVRTGHASVTLWSQPDEVHAAKLRELTPSADPATRTYLAKFSMPNAGDEVQLGMTATLILSEPSSERVARLPLSALFDQGAGPSVYTADATTGRVTLKPVSVKAYESNDVLISGGVEEGAKVVTLGVQKLNPAEKVRVVSSLSF